jgi:phosphomannomutase
VAIVFLAGNLNGGSLVTKFNEFVKTYDVRGLVGSQLTDEVVECFGAAFADELELVGKELVVGHDMRDSSPGFAAAFSLGARKRGANVVMLGLCSTDMNYYASGFMDLPAAMFTASHNPATYNGIKLSRAGARGISLDTGLAAIRDRAAVLFESGIPADSVRGSERDLSVITDYSNYLRKLVPLQGIRKLKIVIDTANGMGGLTVPVVLGDDASIEIVPMYFELDGSFPNHEANPLDSKNLVDLQQMVVSSGADLGLAFDGDADRCFAVDEGGVAVTPSAVAAIVSKREILRVQALGEKTPTVLHNLLTSKSVPETIAAHGAIPQVTKVGHSLIKDQMASSAAVFGGEHSAHYYFREFWGADNGMLAAMHLISELGSQDRAMSEISADYTPYFASGEINSTVTDAHEAQLRAAAEFEGAFLEELDGKTYSHQDGEIWWWCNIRSSNTEPLLRLNVESNQESVMHQIRNRALAAITSKA